MTIFVENKPVETVSNLLKNFPSLKVNAEKFVLKSEQVVKNPNNVLYVHQKEYAIVKKSDKNISIVGSDDATTCHIVVLVNQCSGTLCLAHLDSVGNIESLASMVIETLTHSVHFSNEVSEPACLDLYICGGYDDEEGQSRALTDGLLEFYHKLPVQFELKLMCVGSVNTHHSEGINWPLVYGVAVNLDSTIEILPAKFHLDVRGPCLSLRSARLFCSQNCLYR